MFKSKMDIQLLNLVRACNDADKILLSSILRDAADSLLLTESSEAGRYLQTHGTIELRIHEAEIALNNLYLDKVQRPQPTLLRPSL